MDHNVTTSAYCMTQNCIYFYAIKIKYLVFGIWLVILENGLVVLVG